MVQSGATMRKFDESHVIHNVLLQDYIFYSEVVSLGCVTSPSNDRGRSKVVLPPIVALWIQFSY